jgi:formylglycine-generating enzyme required for sulfatase activity
MGAAAVHPSDQTLRAYGLGKLDDVSSGSVSQHLESCPDCQRRVAEVSSDDFLGRLRGANAAPAMSATNPSQVGDSNAESGPAAAVAPPPADTMPPGLADHPDYEVIRELGRGGMGVVYLVRNKLMGRLEVLKVVGGHLVERPGVRDRFLREVQSAAKLQHKNIVAAYSAMRFGESIVLAMEYIDGDDLAKAVKSSGPLPVTNACYFIYQVALGLQHAHERGMVHRDIKPANLILARDGKKAIVKVLDFGLAKVTSEGQQADSGLTREGQMLGTPDYIAPEQIRDAQSADIRADIYSLGCTFYYLLTGKPPFHGEHLWDVYQAHFSMDAAPLNLVRPEVPIEVAALVAKMMAKEPGRRFQTPAEVAQALKPFCKPAAAQPPGSSAEVSDVNPPVLPTRASVVRPEPTQPTTPVTSPAQGGRTSSKTGADGVAWESLIELNETQEPEDVVAVASQPHGARPRSLWPGIAAACSFAVIALGVIFYATFGVKPGDEKALLVENQPAVSNRASRIAPPSRSSKAPSDDATVSHAEFEPGEPPPTPAATEAEPTPAPEITGPPVSNPPVPPSSTESKPTRPPATAESVAPLPEKLKPTAAKGKLKPGRQLANRWSSPSTGMKFVRIEGGEFMMGSPGNDPEADEDEKPQHTVRISPFYLGIFEVAQQEYAAVTGHNPSAFSSTGPGSAQVADRLTERYPVESLTWLEAIGFCNALSVFDRLKPYYKIVGEDGPLADVKIPDLRGPGYRLPFEAEWEYACRANSRTRYSFGDVSPRSVPAFWHGDNAERKTNPVGMFAPNGFGLFDMHGNVKEFCWDGYDESYYPRSPSADPTGPERTRTQLRAHRGGSWRSAARSCRSAERFYRSPVDRTPDAGFRVARNLSGR